MEMLALILAAVAVFVAHGKQQQIDDLRKRIAVVEKKASEVGRTFEASPAPVPQPVDLTEVQVAMESAAAERVIETAPPVDEPPASESRKAAERAQPEPQGQKKRSKPSRPEFDMEKTVGVHLPVWGGAIMLLIAGFFLARMAADNGFFTPTLGVAACVIGAIALLVAAFGVRHLRITNHELIGSALASASIGTLYATSFLSSAAFGLTSLLTGFLLSAATAALALGIALTFGKTVLIVGLLGGYLAPFFLLAGAPSEALIYLYLTALLVAGAAATIRMGWRQALLPMTVLHFAWLGGLTLVGGRSDSVAVLNVISIVATPLILFGLARMRLGAFGEERELSLLATCLALLVLIVGFPIHGWDPIYLVGFCAMVAGTVVITLMSRSGSMHATYAAAASWIALLVLWRDPEPLQRIAVTAVVIIAVGLPLVLKLLKGIQPTRLSTILCAISAITFVTSMVDLDGSGGVSDLPYLWAVLALAAAGAAAYYGMIFGRRAPDALSDIVFSIFGAASSTYLSLAVVAVVDPSYFALAAALQVLGLSTVYRRYQVNGLLAVTWIYLAGYFCLLLVSIMMPIPNLLRAMRPYLPHTPPWDLPWIALVLPALAFLGAGTVLSKHAQLVLPKVLDAAGVLLLALAASYLILPDTGMVLGLGAASLNSSRFGTLQVQDTLVWTSLWGNALLIIGIAALFAGARLNRLGLLGAGAVVAGATLACIMIIAVLPAYQFWPRWSVPGLPLLNVAITGLIVPGMLALALAGRLRQLPPGLQGLRWAAALVGGLLVLTGLLVDIRHLFHPDLLQGPSGLLERFSYSAGMLAMAFAALVLGARLNSQPLRYGSLAIMLATVAKVFLFDIGGLEGIWRVGSFVAMGIALLAMSWFYGRYVFTRQSKMEKMPAGE